MKKSQIIFPVRRDYNRFVANETFEDYALRFTAKSWRRWSVARVSHTAIGAIAFLALEAIGATITLSFGFTNAFFAILTVSFILFLTGIPLTKYAIRYGVDIDLLTRGAGFGYIGSTITSLIYAGFTFILFAIEASIMSAALQLALNIPLWICYIIASLTVIPLVTHGITLISRFQIATQPIWIILNILPIGFILIKSPQTIQSWFNFIGLDSGSSGFNFIKFGAAASILFGIMPQICEQVDILRFLPKTNDKMNKKNKALLFLAGPGWVIIGIAKLFLGSFLMVFALQQGVNIHHAAEPASMYNVAFYTMFQQPHIALILTAILVIVAQLKINVINAYAGSLAWSNFFSRITHNHPGRIIWLVFNVIVALALMELGVYYVLEKILGLFANFAVAWLATVFADLAINKRLGLAPEGIEFRRGYLYDINPVGFVTFCLATTLSLLAYSGLFGEIAAAISAFIAFFVAIITAPIIAYFTKGRYYIAREISVLQPENSTHKCAICENDFETEDMVSCPAYQQFICSLCCSLDARCHDLCKEHARLPHQLSSFSHKIFPTFLHNAISNRLWRFLLAFLALWLIIASILMLSFYQGILLDSQAHNILLRISMTSFVLLTILICLASWFYTLSEESRHLAEEESQRQNRLLQKEIDAHKVTDKELQKAKETAEAANNAKSRYIVGMSHELRTPLNAILGYAQLLENEQQDRQKAIRIIRRSGEHLSSLIDGLLDISRIETGRLQLQMSEIRFKDFLEQIVDIFRLQAQSKGLKFNLYLPKFLPEYVRADEKRLRQVLINLLSNALKYTDKGHIDFELQWKNGVATIIIRDSGKGIKSSDYARIFEPFVRIEANSSNKTGLGLGLTITKLLINMMGGDIVVASQIGIGTSFTVKLMLSSIAKNHLFKLEQHPKITAYKGARKTIMIVDDDEAQRDLIHDLLTPLGFFVLDCERPSQALELANDLSIDLFILDIQLPEFSGFALAKKIRNIGETAPIIMLSANITEINAQNKDTSFYNATLSKPFTVFTLLQIISDLLEIEWVENQNSVEKFPHKHNVTINIFDLNTLKELGSIGYSIGINNHINLMLKNNVIDEQTKKWLKKLQQKANDFDFDSYKTMLEGAKIYDER